MRCVRLSLAVFAAGLCLAGPAGASLVQFDSVYRAVTARAQAGGAVDGPFSVESSTLGLFDESVSAAVTMPTGGSSVVAGQLSGFEPDRVVAQGTVSSSADSLTDLSLETAGASVFDIVFSVDRSTDVLLLASLSGTASFTFAPDAGPPLLTGSGSVFLTLDAGIAYRLTATAGAALDAPGSDGGAYSVQLIGVPTPAGLCLAALAAPLAARRRRAR